MRGASTGRLGGRVAPTDHLGGAGGLHRPSGGGRWPPQAIWVESSDQRRFLGPKGKRTVSRKLKALLNFWLSSVYDLLTAENLGSSEGVLTD